MPDTSLSAALPGRHSTLSLSSLAAGGGRRTAGGGRRTADDGGGATASLSLPAAAGLLVSRRPGSLGAARRDSRRMLAAVSEPTRRSVLKNRHDESLRARNLLYHLTPKTLHTIHIHTIHIPYTHQHTLTRFVRGGSSRSVWGGQKFSRPSATPTHHRASDQVTSQRQLHYLTVRWCKMSYVNPCQPRWGSWIFTPLGDV